MTRSGGQLVLPSRVRRWTKTEVTIVAAVYLALSTLLWWNVWSTGPASNASCACGDPGLAMWSFSSVAQSIVHLHNPFFTTQLFSPSGFNLLDNTTVIALGTIFAPLTLIFGPVFAVNTALLVVPVATALATYAALRYWVLWRPAMFVGGLLYGFSPFVVSNQLPYGHLNLAFLAIPPLVLLCLRQIICTRQGSALKWGIYLGILLVIEFFVSTEVLAITVLTSAVGMSIVAIWKLLIDRSITPQNLRYAFKSFVMAGAICAVLLAYPAWFALFGPQHISGLAWTGIPIAGNSWRNFFFTKPLASYALPTPQELSLAGYFGPSGPPDPYISFGVPIFLALSALAWFKDRFIWFLIVLFIAVSTLSLGILWLPFGAEGPTWLPWQIFANKPIFENISPDHLSVIGDLCIAVAVGLILDRIRWHSFGSKPVEREDNQVCLEPKSDPKPNIRSKPKSATIRSAVAIGASAIVIVPLILSYSLPFVTRKVTQPAWFANAGRNLPSNSVLLVMPFPNSGLSQAMAWQGIDGMSFSIAGGYGFAPGPNGHALHTGAPASAVRILSDMSYGIASEPMMNQLTIRTIRSAIAKWRISEIVLTGQGRDPEFQKRFFTVVTGEPAHRTQGVLLWTHILRGKHFRTR
ncbi:MAG TPA: hypothetical protein VMU77_05495 [Acidimicrobiales bacterium]|nr:hypothetical protein [Acidimicrobiales bacterium]